VGNKEVSEKAVLH